MSAAAAKIACARLERISRSPGAVLDSVDQQALALPSLAADVRAAAEQRRRELRSADDTKPMSTIPPERDR